MQHITGDNECGSNTCTVCFPLMKIPSSVHSWWTSSTVHCDLYLLLESFYDSKRWWRAINNFIFKSYICSHEELFKVHFVSEFTSKVLNVYVKALRPLEECFTLEYTAYIVCSFLSYLNVFHWSEKRLFWIIFKRKMKFMIRCTLLEPQMIIWWIKIFNKPHVPYLLTCSIVYLKSYVNCR